MRRASLRLHVSQTTPTIRQIFLVGLPARDSNYIKTSFVVLQSSIKLTFNLNSKITFMITNLMYWNSQINGCPAPPDPPTTSGLAVLNFTGDVIPRGGSLLFGCFDEGRKMLSDFNRSTVFEVVCIDGLDWELPAEGWGQCVTSELRMNNVENWKRQINFGNIHLYNNASNTNEQPYLCIPKFVKQM